MRRGPLFAAAAAAAFLAAGQSQAQVTVLWPMAPPADREQVLATVTEDPAAQPQVLRYLLDFDLCTLSASDGSHFIAIDDSYVVFTSMQRLRQVYGADAMPNCSTGSGPALVLVTDTLPTTPRPDVCRSIITGDTVVAWRGDEASNASALAVNSGRRHVCRKKRTNIIRSPIS